MQNDIKKKYVNPFLKRNFILKNRILKINNSILGFQKSN